MFEAVEKGFRGKHCSKEVDSEQSQTVIISEVYLVAYALVLAVGVSNEREARFEDVVDVSIRKALRDHLAKVSGPTNRTFYQNLQEEPPENKENISKEKTAYCVSNLPENMPSSN